MANDVDISENDLLRSHPEVLRKLLLDHTTHKNIFWATESYAHMGEGFGFDDEITVDHITGENGRVIQPRAVKAAEVQTQRAKDMAEVFTSAWICNAQNNLVDNEWFGRTDVFNHALAIEGNKLTEDEVRDILQRKGSNKNGKWVVEQQVQTL